MMMDWSGDKPNWQWGKHQAHHGMGRYARRGDMRPIVLKALADKPMHGYEIIKQLEEKTHGWWRPSPGSIYPMLQMLEDEGAVTSREADGKRVYALTDAGKAEASKVESFGDWSKFSKFGKSQQLQDLAGEFFGLAKLLKTLAHQEDQSRIKEATAILHETSGRLSAMINKHKGEEDGQ